MSTQTDKDTIHTFASGAASSEHAIRYDLIPFHVFLDRLGKRYTDGAAKYSEYNWQKGLRERAYVLDRANHALKHLTRAIEQMRAQTQHSWSEEVGFTEVVMPDDDLAAAMWGVIFLMAAQRGGAELDLPPTGPTSDGAVPVRLVTQVPGERLERVKGYEWGERVTRDPDHTHWGGR